jgi:hypothetical protein
MPDQTWVFTLSILRGHGKEVREQLETFLHSFIGGSDSTPANNQGTKARELNPCKKNLAAREDEILLGKFGRRRTTTTITSRARTFCESSQEDIPPW